MKTLLLVLSFAGALSAQPTFTLTGPATARPGNTVSLSLGISGSSLATAFQWTLGLPTGYTTTGVPGAAAVAATKDLMQCTSNGGTCVLVGGTNNNVVLPGVIATLQMSVPASATAGTASFPLSGLIAANAAGNALPANAGTTYSLLILARQDIDGNGVVNSADVTAMMSQAVASVSNPAACLNDQNGDGKCDVLDVVVVLLKSLGL